MRPAKTATLWGDLLRIVSMMLVLTAVIFGFLRSKGMELQGTFIQYNSLLIVLSSLGLFCAFAGMDLQKERGLFLLCHR